MKRTYLHIICTSLLATLFVGCNIDYPEKDFFGYMHQAVFDNAGLRIPVLVAMDDAQDMVDEELDSAFYVYAFYTPTGVEGAPEAVDYRSKTDCLVGDSAGGKKARLGNDMSSILQWEDDETPHYNSANSLYSYKFFAYYVGDAVKEGAKLQRGADSVAYEIEIDGTQDLMCSVATPTEKQKSKLEGSSLLPYSAETGYWGVYPTFTMEHQLVTLQFSLQSGSAEASRVCVRNLPYRGVFVVAADDEAKMGVDFTAETTDFIVSLGEEKTARCFLPEANNYTIQLDESAPAVLTQDGGFKAGYSYMVEINVIDQDNIEFEVK